MMVGVYSTKRGEPSMKRGLWATSGVREGALAVEPRCGIAEDGDAGADEERTHREAQ